MQPTARCTRIFSVSAASSSRRRSPFGARITAEGSKRVDDGFDERRLSRFSVLMILDVLCRKKNAGDQSRRGYWETACSPSTGRSQALFLSQCCQSGSLSRISPSPLGLSTKCIACCVPGVKRWLWTSARMPHSMRSIGMCGKAGRRTTGCLPENPQLRSHHQNRNRASGHRLSRSPKLPLWS